jgi:isopentenyl-diphosphate Delta-isomerase
MNVVLVDLDDNVVGYKEKFAAHKVPVPLHRAISVVIFNSNGDMLIQKRAKTKKTWPGYWSNTCCSHPFPGEAYFDCANRRLKEEMGIETQLKESFRFVYEAEYEDGWGEHEYDVTFTGIFNTDPKINTEEAEDYHWISLEDLKADIEENPKIYTPWFKLIVENLTQKNAGR